MSSIEQLYGEFVDAWNAALRPDVSVYLQRAAEGDREELAQRLDVWLQIAPTPDYDEQTLAEIRADPVLQAAFAEAEQQEAPLAERVVRLREKAGLSLAALAGTIAERFSLPADERLTGYFTQLESGELDERRLSQRLLDALADTLGVRPAALAPAPAAGHSFFRADEDADLEIATSLKALTEAALTPMSPAHPAEMDELDRLFRGGPGA